MPRKPPERPAKSSRARPLQAVSEPVVVSAAPSPRRRAARKAVAPAAAEVASAPPTTPNSVAAPAPCEADEPRRDAPQAESPDDQPRETPLPNFEALARNVGLLFEEGGKVLAAYFRPLEGRDPGQPGEEIAHMAATLGRIATYYMSDAQRALEAQTALSS